MHRRVFTGPQLHIARKTAYQTRQRPVETEECPLCHIVLGKPRRAFVKHTARHMEEIALMALPRSTEEDLDESSISTNEISQGSKSAGMLAPEIESEACKGISVQGTDGSATTGAVSSITAPPQGPAHAPGNEVEEYIIKCICGFREDDGNTVYCDLCDTWQHTECYYIDKHGNVPTMKEIEVIDHFCADCQPRSLNAKGAVERQRIRRKEFDQKIGKNDQMDKGSIAQPRGNAREKASVSPPKNPPNPIAPPYDELEDPAKPFLCIFVECKRARMEHGFQGFQHHWNLLEHLERVHGYSTPEASNESYSLSPSMFEGSGGFAGADANKGRCKAAAPGRCHSCNRAETPRWRRGPDGAKSLCNSCRLRMSPHHHSSC